MDTKVPPPPPLITPTHIHDLPDECLADILRRVVNTPPLNRPSPNNNSPPHPLHLASVSSTWRAAVPLAFLSLSLHVHRGDYEHFNFGERFPHVTVLTLAPSRRPPTRVFFPFPFLDLLTLAPQLTTLSLLFHPDVNCIPALSELLPHCTNLHTLTAKLTQTIPYNLEPPEPLLFSAMSYLPHLTTLTLEFRIPGFLNMCEVLGAMAALREVHLTSYGIPPASAGRLPTTLRSLVCHFGHSPTIIDTPHLLNLAALTLSELHQSIRVLPACLGSLSALTELRVEKSPGLHSLPGSIGQLADLQVLSVTKCPAHQRLPESIHGLSKLRVLRVEECWSLPESIGSLTCLETLHAKSRLHYVKTLPVLAVVGSLSRLRSLKLLFKRALPDLPEDLGALSALEELEIRGCVAQSLPESLSTLTCLRSCTLGLDSIRELPEIFASWQRLETLVVKCREISLLPGGVCQLAGLRKLSIMSCHKLEALPEDVGGLTALTSLRVFHCKRISSLPESIGRLSSLEVLLVQLCDRFQALPASVRELSSLRDLRVVSRANALERLPEGMELLPRLARLECPFSLLRAGLRRVWVEPRVSVTDIARESDLDSDSDPNGG